MLTPLIPDMVPTYINNQVHSYKYYKLIQFALDRYLHPLSPTKFPSIYKKYTHLQFCQLFPLTFCQIQTPLLPYIVHIFLFKLLPKHSSFIYFHSLTDIILHPISLIVLSSESELIHT